MNMRKVESVERPRNTEAYARVLRSIVSDLTVVELAFGRGIPRYLGDYDGVFDELVTAAGIEGEAAKV
jgi:chromosome partitioning protein